MVVSPAWYDDYVLTVGSVNVRRRTVGIHHGWAVGRCRRPWRRGGIAELNGWRIG